jgi:Putative restriction endonuclease
MTVVVTQPSIENPEGVTIPPLQNGDRLDRIEFERRYAAMPNVIKAQLIEGVVYMPSPVTYGRHGSPHFDLIGWLALYRFATPRIKGGDNTTLRLDLDNEPQPDAFLNILPSHGGQARIDADDYLVGAPELVAEVSATTVSIDLKDKFNAYRRNGVREYVVWRVLERAIDWFILREGTFIPMALTEGHYHSEIFPGLWLDPKALINDDMARVSQVAQQGIATPEHAAFVARLQQAAATTKQP